MNMCIPMMKKMKKTKKLEKSILVFILLIRKSVVHLIPKNSLAHERALWKDQKKMIVLKHCLCINRRKFLTSKMKRWKRFKKTFNQEMLLILFQIMLNLKAAPPLP